MQLSNKVSVITGASRGIGKATALKFAREGARVVVGDMDDAVAETVAEIRLLGGTAIGFKVDVTSADSITEMVRGALKSYGRIDILVNNGGTVADAQLKKMTEQQFDKAIDVNLKGTYNCTRAVVDVMLKQKSGVVLNTSTMAAIAAGTGQTGHAAGKFGVIGMAKTWAKELGRHGIRVNAVCPGLIEIQDLRELPKAALQAMTEQVPLGRFGRPDEVASALAFLASDEASYINGAVIEVCGGMTW